MVLSAAHKWPFVINLGNSIIGVAVLAMPFCFKQCGIILGILVLLFCTWLTLASCQLLVKAGIMSHYQSYEFLAYHTYGAPGKFLVEMGMIGMQLGTLVAQIVVIGDLGPPIISILFGFENNWKTRMYLIIFLCLFVGLPLGLMKDLRNVSRASTVCIAFYSIFSVYILWLSSDKLWTGEWYSHVNFWRPQGFFQCLPIMSFSFGCQTQLFILYDALPEPSLQAIKGIIHSAVNLCAVTYLLVGFFGYVTFYNLDIPGDIITVFPATVGTHLIKLGFVMSIAITFPVIIYPCRASLYTLLFQKKSKHMDVATSTYIPENLFKGITVTIVLGSMITGILIPNVEFVLGINGAITGTLICYIFPALFFLQVSKPEGRTIAKIVLALGVAILLVSTFTTLNAQDKSHASEEVQKAAQEAAERVKVPDLPQDHVPDDKVIKEVVQQLPQDSEKKKEGGGTGHLEPPVPFAPPDNNKPQKQAIGEVQKEVPMEKREVDGVHQQVAAVQQDHQQGLVHQGQQQAEQQGKGVHAQQQAVVEQQPVVPQQQAGAGVQGVQHRVVQQVGVGEQEVQHNQQQEVVQGAQPVNQQQAGAQGVQNINQHPAGGGAQGVQNVVNQQQQVAQGAQHVNKQQAQGQAQQPAQQQDQVGIPPQKNIVHQDAHVQDQQQAAQPLDKAQQQGGERQKKAVIGDQQFDKDAPAKQGGVQQGLEAAPGQQQPAGQQPVVGQNAPQQAVKQNVAL